VWDKIINIVNALGVCKQDVMNSKEKWRSMTSAAKRGAQQVSCLPQKDHQGQTASCLRKTQHLVAFSGISSKVNSLLL